VVDSKWAERWTVVLNTAEEKDFLSEQDIGPEISAAGKVQVQAWSLVVLRGVSPS